MPAQTDTPRVTVLAGPSGVGKGTVVAELLKQYPHLKVSVSATTRQPRPGEIEGKDYYFVSPQAFDDLIANGQMLEWAQIHGVHRYGTPRGPVDQWIAEGHPVLLEIDLEGARQIRKTMPEAQFVFLAPPSWEELVRRLEGRGTEDDDERERRLNTAQNEMAAAHEFDTVVINDHISHAVNELAPLIGLQ